MTGASRGIGRAVALELARAGAHIIALARTQGGLEELDDAIRGAGSEATLVPCDLKDFEALDRLGAAIFERWGKLDILIGNGGVLGPLSPLAHVEPKQWEDVLAVNVTANWRLIRSLDPLLRAADAGRVVFISSGAAHAAEFQALLGTLCDHQGRAGRACPHLCRRNDEYLEGQGHDGQSRAAADKDAGGGDARRRPDESSNARGVRAENSRTLLAGMVAHRQALRFSGGSRAQFYGAFLSSISLKRAAGILS